MENKQDACDDTSQLILHAKLEAMAEFAAGAGHEINNPLATISGRVQLLLRNETDPQKRQSLKTIGGQVYRIRDMIGDAMLFGRPPEPNRTLLNLIDILHDVQSRLQSQIDESKCQIENECDADVTVWADSDQLKVMLSQLILNSLSASTKGDRILLESHFVTKDQQPFALFQVTDWGCGMTPEEQEHLFDPFYSGRQAGRGLGFGLSKCWRLAQLHGGDISVKTADGTTCFSLLLPANESACCQNQTLPANILNGETI